MPPRRRAPVEGKPRRGTVPVQGNNNKKKNNDKFMVQLCCVPSRVTYVNDILKSESNDPRFAFIMNTCFKGLAMVGTKAVRLKPMLSLIARWDTVEECFHLLDGRRLVITDEDVARVYGLPRGFGKVPLDINLTTVDGDFARKFGKKYNLKAKRESTVRDDDLQRILMNKEHSIWQNCLDYWRLYVLNALYSLLIPTSDRCISLKFLQFLRTPEAAEGFNWASLVRDRLVSGLNKWVEKLRSGRVLTSGRPTGDLHCLMYILRDKTKGASATDRCFSCNDKWNLTEEFLDEVFGKVSQPIPEAAVPWIENDDVSDVGIEEPFVLEITNSIKADEVEEGGNSDGVNEMDEDACVAEILFCADEIQKYTARKEAAEKKLNAILSCQKSNAKNTVVKPEKQCNNNGELAPPGFHIHPMHRDMAQGTSNGVTNTPEIRRILWTNSNDDRIDSKTTTLIKQELLDEVLIPNTSEMKGIKPDRFGEVRSNVISTSLSE